MTAADTEHVCDDSAYPAAAMPDECTCWPPPDTDESEREAHLARLRIFGEDA